MELKRNGMKWNDETSDSARQFSIHFVSLNFFFKFRWLKYDDPPDGQTTMATFCPDTL